MKGADVVLLGWHKPVLGKTVLSGTVHEVMQRAQATVGVLVDRGLGWVSNVLVPYSGSVHDQGALLLAQRLAWFAGANVTVLRVVGPGADARALPTDGAISELLEKETQEGEGKITVKVVEHASPGRAVVEEARHDYGLVVIGVGPEWGLEHRSFGMQSELIIEQCPTSLLIVRQWEPALARQALPPGRDAAGSQRRRAARERS